MRRSFLVVGFIITGCADEDAEPKKHHISDADMVTELDEPCTTMILKKADVNSGIKPILTVEESLAVAFRSRIYRYRLWHICRGVNPDALPRIVELLKNPAEKEILPSAIEAVAYVGGDPEALFLETILRKKYAEPWTPKEEEAFNTAILTIGLMARREVPEARRIANCYCEPDYWLDTAQPWMSEHPLGIHAIARVKAMQGKLLADWAVDADLCKRLITENQDFEGYANATDLNDMLCRMSVEESTPITQAERHLLRKFYDEYLGE